MLQKIKNSSFFRSQRELLYVGTAWGSAGIASFLIYIQYMRGIEKKHTYIREALQLVQENETLKTFLGENTKIKIKSANIDSSKLFAKCKFEILGENKKSVVVYASAKKLKEEKTDAGDDDDNFIERENEGLSYYWQYPFLLKKTFVDFSKNCVQKVFSAFTLKHEEEGLAEEKDSDLSFSNDKTWLLNSVLCDISDEKNANSFLNFFTKFNMSSEATDVLPQHKLLVLHGQVMANPYIEKFINNDGRNDLYISRGRFLTYAFLSVGCASLLLLSTQRLLLSYKKFAGIGFAKAFAKQNKEISQLMGDKITVLNVTGVQKSTYVNSKIYIQANNGKLAHLNLVAARNSLRDSFRVLRSELVLGKEVHKLKCGDSTVPA